MDEVQVESKQIRLSKEVKNDNKVEQWRKAEAVCKDLGTTERKAVLLAEEKGSSSWLNPLPVEENGFALHKGTFQDAMHCIEIWMETKGNA